MRKHLSATSAKLVAAFIALAALTVVSSACQSASAPTAASPPSNGFPIVLHATDGSNLTINSEPHRIVSLSPTATEMLFAVGAGRQVVAVDADSNYPPSAPVTTLSGFQPNIEAIAGYAPDLVIASDDTGGLVHGLASVGIPTLLEPAATNLSGTYDQILQLGSATGHVAAATALATRIRSQIASIVASAGKPTRPLTVYHELDDTYYSATSRTFIGQLYALLGLRNIADGASAAAPDYPQLSSEYIVNTNPDLIVLADTKCCHQDLQSVASRPGWGSISAVQKGDVVGVDDDVASRWGPRVVDFLRVIAQQVRQLEQKR